MTLSFNFERGFDPHILQPTDTHIMGMFYSMLLMMDFKTLKVVPNLADTHLVDLVKLLRGPPATSIIPKR